jgi:DNA-binding transcriptional MerR regulator
VEVEQHTLRYWEEELDLDIPRNEMGHRYYREEDIEIFKLIKTLKEKGYGLRAIKMALPDIQKANPIESEKIGDIILTSLPVSRADTEDNQSLILDKSIEKLDQFKTIMNHLITEALQDNNELMSESLGETVSNKVIKEMDYLLRVKEDREEERFKQFDRTIREMQNSRTEVAVTKFNKLKKKRSFFTKNK